MKLPTIIFLTIATVIIVQILAVVGAYQVYRISNPYVNVEQNEPLNEIKADNK